MQNTPKNIDKKVAIVDLGYTELSFGNVLTLFVCENS